jgi:carboxypeptidase family protein
MYRTHRTTSHFALLVLLLALAVLALAGCGSGSSPGPAPQPDQVTTISGQVVYRDTGQPYAGAWVEFRNLSGWYVTSTTDADGHYSLTLPADTYTVDAGDDNDLNETFDAVGLAGNAVTVPPSMTINFVAFPIT